MNIRYTKGTLEKIEKILSDSKYILRYEKGTFNSGYCVLEHKKVVVVNKFLDVEGRINILLDILPVLQITADHLPQDSGKLYRQLVLAHQEGVAEPFPGEAPDAGDLSNDESIPNND